LPTCPFRKPFLFKPGRFGEFGCLFFPLLPIFFFLSPNLTRTPFFFPDHRPRLLKILSNPPNAVTFPPFSGPPRWGLSTQSIPPFLSGQVCVWKSPVSQVKVFLKGTLRLLSDPPLPMISEGNFFLYVLLTRLTPGPCSRKYTLTLRHLSKPASYQSRPSQVPSDPSSTTALRYS